MDAQRFGIGLLTHSYEYSFDHESEFSKVYKTEMTSIKLNMFYLHAWLLSYRIAKQQSAFALKHDNFIISLNNIIERDNAFIYSNEYDEYVHHELKRQQRVLFRSLNDYYWYQNTMGRSIEDIIYLDVLNENEIDQTEQVQSIKSYVQ